MGVWDHLIRQVRLGCCALFNGQRGLLAGLGTDPLATIAS